MNVTHEGETYLMEGARIPMTIEVSAFEKNGRQESGR